MEIKDFIANFKEIFDFDLDEEGIVLTGETVFKELDDWDSLTALSLIAMADDEYSVSVNGDDIRGVSTLQELMELVEKKK